MAHIGFDVLKRVVLTDFLLESAEGDATQGRLLAMLVEESFLGNSENCSFLLPLFSDLHFIIVSGTLSLVLLTHVSAKRL